MALMKHFKFIFISLMLLFGVNSLYAGEIDEQYYDSLVTAHVYDKHPEMKNTDHKDSIIPVEFAPLDEFVDSELQQVQNNRVASKDDGYIYTFIIILLVILAVAYIIYRLRLNPNMRNEQVRLESATTIQEAEADLLKVSLDDLIANAEQSGDFRMLVHLHYLELLRALHHQNHIAWEAYKTNGQYTYEIQILELRKEYAQLTVFFDRVWYGYKEIDQQNYQLWLERVNAIRS